jgi:outer membrane protein, multidrug efflux system
MKPRLPSSAMALALVAAGCASAPPIRDPDIGVAVPEAWTAAADPAAPATQAWWHELGGLPLDAVVSEALAGNRDLRTAAARLDQAAALARVEGAREWPVAGVGVSAARRKQNFIGLPIPGAEDRVLSTRVTTYGVSIDSSWEADLWGRIRSGAAASLADAEAAAFDVDGARLSLAAQAARTWFALIEARQQLRLAEATAETYQATADQVRDRYERGLRPPVDLRLALSNLHAAEAVRAARQEQYARVQRQFELLLGRYPSGVFEAPDTLPRLPGAVPAGLPADLLARRPDLLAAERRLAAADARLVANRRALYPALALTGSGGFTTNLLRRLLDGDFSVWSLAGAVTQPIFQGGRLRAQVDIADAQAREALEWYAARALTAFAEVETALDAQGHLAERAQQLRDAAEQARAALALAEQRYGAGLEPLFVVLEAQRRQAEAESQLLTVNRLQLDTRVDLHLALGGNFEDQGAGTPDPVPEQ